MTCLILGVISGLGNEQVGVSPQCPVGEVVSSSSVSRCQAVPWQPAATKSAMGTYTDITVHPEKTAHIASYKSSLKFTHTNIYIIFMKYMCVVMPLHEWATGSLPPAGRPPTRQVGPSEVHVSV